jgi:hypothetical protein
MIVNHGNTVADIAVTIVGPPRRLDANSPNREGGRTAVTVARLPLERAG